MVSYFVVAIGNSLELRRARVAPKAIKSTLKLAKSRVTLTQTCYKGGRVIAVIPRHGYVANMIGFKSSTKIAKVDQYVRDYILRHGVRL